MTSKSTQVHISSSPLAASGAAPGRRLSRTASIVVAALTLLCAGAFAAGAAQAGPVCRVAPGGTPSNSGADWAHPMDLMTAVQTYGCNEVWVAQGVYKAVNYPNTFKVHTGAQLYGGFAGNETTRGQRDWLAHPTVLSGDKDNDDLNSDGNFVSESYQDIRGSNSHNVLELTGTRQDPIDGSTVIDGFTITGGDGRAIGGFGGGLICFGVSSGNRCSPTLRNLVFSGNASKYGGALYLNGGQGGESSPQLSHVIFVGNYADQQGGAIFSNGASGGVASAILSDVAFFGNSSGYYGGGMFNDAHGSGRSNPSLTNVTFDSNDAFYQGGGMLNYGYGGESSPTLMNVTFSNNLAQTGGGMYNTGTKDTSSVAGKSHATLRNVTFSNNHANAKGGAIMNYGENGGDMDIKLTNVTFSGNSAGQTGGAMFNTAYASGLVTASLKNVIMWGNTAGSGGSDIYIRDTNFASTDLSIDYSVVEGGDAGIAYETGASSTAYTYGGFNVQADPGLGPLADHGGLTQTMLPTAGDSAVDAGICAGAPSQDQRGVTRPTGSNCDIGSVELVALPDAIFSNGFE